MTGPEPARLLDAVALRRALQRIEGATPERDPTPVWLFLGALAIYWVIGELIVEVQGFDAFNYFFNADCPRVISDLTRAHREAAADAPAEAAHPLFLILLNPIGSTVSRALGRSDLLASLLLCHAGAALANVVFYWVMRRLGLRQRTAAAAAVTFALSTTQLVSGSIVETYAFVGLAMMASVLVSLATSRPERAALVHVVPFGLNVALAPYSILAAPVLWLGRLPSRKWVFRTALFWLCLLACALVLLKLQHDLYPDTNFFHKKILVDYATNYSDAATGFEHRLRRWARLIPHLVAFDVVAPVPLFTGKPDRITTFMWDGGVHKVALYSAFGWVVAAIWIVVFAIASFSNLRSLFRGDAERLGVRLLSMGWLFGVFWLFTRFGDDFLLYSELWAAHVVLWVFLGLEEYATTRYGRALEWGSLAFVVTLAANNFAFVSRMLEFYR